MQPARARTSLEPARAPPTEADAWTNQRGIYTSVMDCQESDHKPVVALLTRGADGVAMPTLRRRAALGGSSFYALLGAAFAAVTTSDLSDDGDINLSPGDLDGNGVIGDFDGDGALGMRDVALIAGATVATVATISLTGSALARRWSRGAAMHPALSLGVITWNMGGAKVTSSAFECIVRRLRTATLDAGQPEHSSPDAYIVGLQEVVALNPGNGILHQIGWRFHRLKELEAMAMLEALNQSCEEKYELLGRETLYGLHLMAFKKASVDLRLALTATTPVNWAGSKGGVALRLAAQDGATISAINMHLPSKFLPACARAPSVLIVPTSNAHASPLVSWLWQVARNFKMRRSARMPHSAASMRFRRAGSRCCLRAR